MPITYEQAVQKLHEWTPSAGLEKPCPGRRGGDAARRLIATGRARRTRSDGPSPGSCTMPIMTSGPTSTPG